MDSNQDGTALMRELLDQAAIRNVIRRYFFGIDARDWDALASCYTADARHESRSRTGVSTGIDEIMTLTISAGGETRALRVLPLHRGSPLVVDEIGGVYGRGDRRLGSVEGIWHDSDGTPYALISTSGDGSKFRVRYRQEIEEAAERLRDALFFFREYKEPSDRVH